MRLNTAHKHGHLDTLALLADADRALDDTRRGAQELRVAGQRGELEVARHDEEDRLDLKQGEAVAADVSTFIVTSTSRSHSAAVASMKTQLQSIPTGPGLQPPE